MQEQIGIIALEELHRRVGWHYRPSATFLEAAGLQESNFVAHRLTTPRVLIVIAPLEYSEIVLWQSAWLKQVEAIVLLRDFSKCSEIAQQPELLEVSNLEFQEAICLLPTVRAVVDWMGTPKDKEPVRRALDEAERLLQELPSTPDCDPLPGLETPAALSPGPWFLWEFGERSTTRHVFLLANKVCIYQHTPLIHNWSKNAFVNMHTGEMADNFPTWNVFGKLNFSDAVSPNGSFALILRGSTPRFHNEFTFVNREKQLIDTFEGPRGRPVGIDPHGTVAWIGRRASFDWLYMSNEKAGFLCHGHHNRPCAHARKLYGYENNYPRWVHLDPSFKAYLSVYDHDALISDTLPIQWNAVGRYLVAHWDMPENELRALFYARFRDGNSPADALEWPGPDDERDLAPTIVLGPDNASRYVLDLYHWVFRLANENTVHVGGPEDSYGVFDAHHNLVRKANGKLLAGWHQWLICKDEGHLWREEITTAKRTDLGAETREITGAFAVPGTPNAVLVFQHEEECWLRFV